MSLVNTVYRVSATPRTELKILTTAFSCAVLLKLQF